MGTRLQKVRVELEDVGGTSGWASLLTALTGHYGNALLRFVAGGGSVPRYTSPTFTAPRTFGAEPPSERWAPGMQESLAALCRDLEADGWVATGPGTDAAPWALTFERLERATPG